LGSPLGALVMHDHGTERSSIALTSTPIARSPIGPMKLDRLDRAFVQLSGLAPGTWPPAATRHFDFL